MELIASINSVDMFKRIFSSVEGIVLGCAYSFYANRRFNEEEIKEIINLNNKKKKIFLNIERGKKWKIL